MRPTTSSHWRTPLASQFHRIGQAVSISAGCRSPAALPAVWRRSGRSGTPPPRTGAAAAPAAPPAPSAWRTAAPPAPTARPWIRRAAAPPRAGPESRSSAVTGAPRHQRACVNERPHRLAVYCTLPTQSPSIAHKPSRIGGSLEMTRRGASAAHEKGPMQNPIGVRRGQSQASSRCGRLHDIGSMLQIIMVSIVSGTLNHAARLSLLSISTFMTEAPPQRHYYRSLLTTQDCVHMNSAQSYQDIPWLLAHAGRLR